MWIHLQFSWYSSLNQLYLQTIFNVVINLLKLIKSEIKWAHTSITVYAITPHDTFKVGHRGQFCPPNIYFFPLIPLPPIFSTLDSYFSMLHYRSLNNIIYYQTNLSLRQTLIFNICQTSFYGLPNTRNTCIVGTYSIYEQPKCTIYKLLYTNYG